MSEIVHAGCADCTHAKSIVLDTGEQVLECRRFPPQLFTAEEPNFTPMRDPNHQNLVITQGWPQMADDDKCGEWFRCSS